MVSGPVLFEDWRILDSIEIGVVRCPVYFFRQHGCPGRCSEGSVWPPAGAADSSGPRFVWRRAAMQIDERVVDGVMILDLKGKMTLGEGDELLKDKINSLIQQDQKKLLLNLEGVPYIDSAGLGEIVRTYTTVSRQGGKLKLLNLTKRIQDLLAITKLLTVFETYENEAEAVKSFST
jgi:anti-sigma B factor antagonist